MLPEQTANIETGSATVIANDCNPPYTYNWDNGMVGSTVSGLSPGFHDVTITDGLNYEIQESIFIAGPEIIVDVFSSVDVTCFGANDGTASVSLSAGTPPFAYNWSDNVNDGYYATGLNAGIHSVEVTDANGCTGYAEIEILHPEPFTISVATTDESCAGCNDGVASMTTVGGFGNYDYIVTEAISGDEVDPSALPPGVYLAEVFDENTCSAISTFEINAAEDFPADIESGFSNHSLTVFPNPVKDFATLKLPEAILGQVTQIRLLDISGKVHWTDYSNAGTYTFNKGNAVPGIYILETISNGNRGSIKLILE